MYIYPKPKIVDYNDDVFLIKENTYLYVDEEFENEDFFELLCELWQNFTFSQSKLTIKKSPNLKGQACLCNEEKDIFASETPGEYEYTISVSKKDVSVSYDIPQGLIHAFTTLLQEIEFEDGKALLQCGNIMDSPSVSFRGIHFCVFPETTLDFLKQNVRLAGFLKYTHVILEFWGMLKYDAMESLAWDFAYTKDDIRPIIKDAHAYGMEVIPMFNHLGHASGSRAVHGRHVVLDQDPSKHTLFEPDGWTWCLSNPETKELLRKVRKELIELCGNSKYFHIGCDEAESLATCRKCRKRDKTELLTEYLLEVQKELSTDGIRPIIWADGFLEKGDYPEKYVSLGDEETCKVIDKLNKEFVMADWQYEVYEAPVKSTDYIKSKGFDVILCPFHPQKNIEVLGQYAQNNFGFLATTWHLLHEKYSMIISGAYISWCGEMETLKSKLSSVANILRKLSPSGGDFEKAGWHEKEESTAEIY